MRNRIEMRAVASALALAALPATAASQERPAAFRGCPPAPTTSAATPPVAVPSLGGVVTELPLIAPHDGWEVGLISGVDTDRSGLIYLVQRGDKADPIVVVDREGRVVRSWGKGLFDVPHSIRIDAKGHVWTTDTYTSTVRKFTPEGRELLRIDVGGVPADCAWRTRGATDVAFGPNDHVYVADGYTNARIVEYTPDGRKVREWGTRGSGPGEFNTPHSIVIDETGILYVADRENRRVQRFSLDGRWLGEWSLGGEPYTLELAPGGMWVAVLFVPAANVVQRTLVRVNRNEGTVTGSTIMPGVHGVAALHGGTQLLIPSMRGLHVMSIPR